MIRTGLWIKCLQLSKWNSYSFPKYAFCVFTKTIIFWVSYIIIIYDTAKHIWKYLKRVEHRYYL
jgi:hypothetical protein